MFSRSTSLREAGLNQDETIIAAVTRDDSPDSGQLVLQAMKSCLADRGWHDVQLVNRVNRCARYIEERQTIVIVDEFSGSGTTMISRCRAIRGELTAVAEQKSFELALDIRVGLLFAMAHAAKRIAEEAQVDVFAVHEFTRGISDHFTGKALKKARRRVVPRNSGNYSLVLI